MPPAKLQIHGKPTFLLGVNYWSRRGGPRMWDRFDADVVRAELRQMRAMGLNTCRSFCFIPSFMPAPPAVSDLALGRMRQLFDLCQAEEMTTIPTFLVGHMSGENHDFPGQGARSLYADPELLDWQRALVDAVARLSAGHPAVAAYLASNEMPLWGGRGTVAEVAAWAGELRDTLRARDAARPFSLGDGVMNLEGGQNGFDPLALRDRLLVDFVGPHSYYADADALRQALNAELCVRSLTHLGLPVLFEELGCSSTQASEDNQRLYYREAIHACLSAGGSGALGWCFSDFDLVDEPPYRHHAFELGFGITRADGSEKPVCDELRQIAALVQRLGFAELRPPRPRAAILVPAYYNETFPFSCEDRGRMRRTLLQAYVLCAAAGIEAELVPEQAIDLARYELLLAPATQKLLAPTWRDLLQRARQGATLYWSYFAGDSGWLHGAWCQNIDELTGCRHGLRYGCFDPPADPFVLAGSGLDIELRPAGTPQSRSLLPVEPAGADVLARDSLGRPALVRARHGQGQVVFLNHPLEHYLAEQADQLPASGAHRLYRLLARLTGIQPAVTSSEPVVQARVVERDGSPPLLWLVNHGWASVQTTVDSPGGEPLHGTTVPLDEGSCQVELEPKQVAVYLLG